MLRKAMHCMMQTLTHALHVVRTRRPELVQVVVHRTTPILKLRSVHLQARPWPPAAVLVGHVVDQERISIQAPSLCLRSQRVVVALHLCR